MPTILASEKKANESFSTYNKQFASDGEIGKKKKRKERKTRKSMNMEIQLKKGFYSEKKYTDIISNKIS